MIEKAGNIRNIDYKIYCPIITRRQYTPEIAKIHQNQLLTKLSENICSLTQEDHNKFHSKWESILNQTTSRNPKTYRFGIAIQHADKLICPHPFVEINHSFGEKLKCLIDFNKFYRKPKRLTESL
jgi:hypothetical protein